jgi:hypothetical protein
LEVRFAPPRDLAQSIILSLPKKKTAATTIMIINSNEPIIATPPLFIMDIQV